MVFKRIIEGKSAFYCDICNKELSLGERSTIYVETIWNSKTFHLCKKHGKIIERFIKEQKSSQDVETERGLGAKASKEAKK